MTAEQWRPVAGYEGHYEVSDAGRVRSLERDVMNNGSPQRRGGMVMKTFFNRYGYPCVKLSRSCKSSARSVHVLVATAFVPRPSWATQVRHLNGDHADPAATNLAWGTQSENELDKRTHGTARSVTQLTCLRDHHLVAPNLITADGRRRCLACKRARDEVRDAQRRRHQHLDLNERAAWHYAQIMEGVAA